MAGEPMKYVTFSSAADASFWHGLCDRKLKEYKLSEEPRSLTGFFNIGTRAGVPARLCVGGDSFGEANPVPKLAFPMAGTLLCTNTVDAFKSYDMASVTDAAAGKIWADIEGGAVLADPSLANRFVLLTYADLKKYHFYYWFGFPAIKATVTVTPSEGAGNAARPFLDVYDAAAADTVAAGAQAIFSKAPSATAFLYRASSGEVLPFGDLATWPADEPLVVGIADPSGSAEHPGWPVRNMLAAVSHHSPRREVRVLCYREVTRQGRTDISGSLIFDVQLGERPAAGGVPGHIKGWEKNHKQKLSPRICNLSSSMDPKRLAASAVDLNLSLMRWRLMPEVDLPMVAGTKCLLVGAGTLGCNVARCLMGWGVRNITFVDSGKVSYSNPVRQTLFTFDDCLEGGKPKAAAAAESMKNIFPDMNTRSVCLSVPMPGYRVDKSAEEDVMQAVSTLESLIEEHDAVFLLTDTRESRWLPTVMCAARDKVCITAALGFDGFLVMRHGVSAPTTPTQRTVGCYFCNDAKAPANSSRDRTLDQQCTVSRPGLSMISSACAVELLVAILHHPDGAAAPASAGEAAGNGCPMGAVPHQLRGSLQSFQNMVLGVEHFDKCTACSQTVIDLYRKGGREFLLQVFANSSYLEDVTGLTDMFAATEAGLEDAAWMEDGSGDEWLSD